MEQGENLTLTYMWMPGKGNHTMAAGADIYYEIEEISEENNVAAPPVFVPPVAWEKARGDVSGMLQQIQNVGGNIMDLVSASLPEEKYDVNRDGAVNIVDAYLILKQVRLISIEPPVMPRQAATMLLRILEAQYGPQLVNYPIFEGRIYLLCMLYLIL